MTKQDFENIAKKIYCTAHDLDVLDMSGDDAAEIRAITEELQILKSVGQDHLLNCLICMTADDEENPDVRKFSWADFRRILSEFNAAYHEDGQDIYGVIVFTKDSWDEEYPLVSRSYRVSSCNGWDKARDDYSILGTSLDESDINVRLDRYMADEAGGPDGWKVSYCYLEGLM
jgi:hypothetical protein